MSKTLNIYAPGSNIGGYKDCGKLVLEPAQSPFSCLLRQVSMECFSWVAVLHKAPGHLVGLYLSRAEHKAMEIIGGVDNTLKCLEPVISLYKNSLLVHQNLFLLRHILCNNLSLPQLFIYNLHYGGGECGREKSHLLIRVCAIYDFLNIIDEPHIQHLVGLVQNQIFDFGKVQAATVYVILHTAGSAHHNLGSFLKVPKLQPY